MGIYERLGVRRVINANATLTRLGGSTMPPEVVAAMAEASGAFVNITELQERVGARIAELTRNEAAFVCAGAAAGLTLAAAACIAGDDHAAARRLPDTEGMRNEIVVLRSQRNGYDHALRQAGARLVEIGFTLGTAPWELESAITSRTAAVCWFQGAMTGQYDLPLERVIAISKERGVPVIVDAAAQLPPAENLWKYTGMGAALAVFSGGKDLRGPQSSGLILGRRDLIDACRIHSSPYIGIGRPMKVGKEEMAGLLAAVERYLTLDFAARVERDERIVAEWCVALNRLPGVRARRAFPNEAGQPLPWACVTLDETVIGKTRDAVIAALADGDPSVSVDRWEADALFVNPMPLADGEDSIVLERLCAALSGTVANATAL